MAYIGLHQKQPRTSADGSWIRENGSCKRTESGRNSSDTEPSKGCQVKNIYAEIEEVFCGSSHREVPVLKNMQCRSQSVSSGKTEDETNEKNICHNDIRPYIIIRTYIIMRRTEIESRQSPWYVPFCPSESQFSACPQ